MKTETMEIRVQPDEKLSFKTAAELAGLPLSAWARERLRQCTIRELESAGLPVPFVRRIPIKRNEIDG